MATDFREIQLTDDQKRRLAELADQTGRPWRELVDERLSSPTPAPDNGADDVVDNSYIEDYDKRKAFFDAWLKRQRSRNPNVDDSRESIYPDRW